MVKKSYLFFLFFAGVVVSALVVCTRPRNCGCPSTAIMPIAQDRSIMPKSGMRLSVSSLSPLTLCEAIWKAAQAVKAPEDDLGPATKVQELFLDTQYLPYIKEAIQKKFATDELQSYASRNYQELNAILKNKGFSIQLPQFSPTNIGIVAIQDVLVKWLLEGSKDIVSADNIQYDGVALKVDEPKEGPMMGQQNMHFFAQDAASVIIIQLLTQSQDRVYFVTKRDGDLFDKQPTTAQVADAIVRYSTLLKEKSYPSVDDSFNGILFPMISYDEQPDVSWIEKMRIGTAHIALALQQVIFKMNEKGARAQAAVAMIMMTAYPGMKHKEQLVINKPFLVWVERPGVSLPIFAGYMTKNYWKNPGSLD